MRSKCKRRIYKKDDFKSTEVYVSKTKLARDVKSKCNMSVLLNRFYLYSVRQTLFLEPLFNKINLLDAFFRAFAELS